MTLIIEKIIDYNNNLLEFLAKYYNNFVLIQNLIS